MAKKTPAKKAEKAAPAKVKAAAPVKHSTMNCDVPHKRHESGRYDLPQIEK